MAVTLDHHHGSRRCQYGSAFKGSVNTRCTFQRSQAPLLPYPGVQQCTDPHAVAESSVGQSISAQPDSAAALRASARSSGQRSAAAAKGRIAGLLTLLCCYIPGVTLRGFIACHGC
eukprot:TRINITY_DN11286_c0_g1_i1.p1 TRINITY_DN11286_c0_g1~~TRINITY_DN11286_c0_g1_i1.p1  ORF type:complete len:116 (-),score=16.82 TRINITY_DN11286_c0_g1_i1:46-393(-)